MVGFKCTAPLLQGMPDPSAHAAWCFLRIILPDTLRQTAVPHHPLTLLHPINPCFALRPPPHSPAAGLLLRAGGGGDPALCVPLRLQQHQHQGGRPQAAGARAGRRLLCPAPPGLSHIQVCSCKSAGRVLQATSGWLHTSGCIWGIRAQHALQQAALPAPGAYDMFLPMHVPHASSLCIFLPPACLRPYPAAPQPQRCAWRGALPARSTR